MYGTDPELFLGLDPQPRRFEATVRADSLYQKALLLLQSSSGVETIVGRYATPEREKFSSESWAAAVELATRCALQTFFDAGELTLNVFSPSTDRFFKLPRGALRNWLPMGEVLTASDYAIFVPEELWRTGKLVEQEASSVISRLARSGLPVFVTGGSEAACLRRLKAEMQEASCSAPQSVSEEEVVETIRELVLARGGRLPLNEGAALVRASYPAITRDAARSLIKSVVGVQKPGPTGPRNRAAHRAG